jgi:hypothetical protein
MFVLCIAWLGIQTDTMHRFLFLLFITQAATCFGTYVPFSGSVLFPCELLKVRNGCFRDVPLYCKCWWSVCTGCCGLVCCCVQLSSALSNFPFSVLFSYLRTNLHNTRLTKFIMLLETISKGLFRNRSHNVLRSIPKIITRLHTNSTQ